MSGADKRAPLSAEEHHRSILERDRIRLLAEESGIKALQWAFSPDESESSCAPADESEPTEQKDPNHG